MKLISLNIWGGHIREPLLEFINGHQSTDIFCFQEVYHNAEAKISTDDRKATLDIFDHIQKLLPTHQGFFRPVVGNIYGLAAFVKKNIEVIDEGEVHIHKNPDYLGQGPAHSRNMQWLKCCASEKHFSVLNVHGLWNGMGKTDTPARIAQSYEIKKFMDTVKTPRILCGDFNLRPDTESLKILEEGMENLIQKYEIQSTRTSLYPKEERFADYVLISPETVVEKEFKVLPDEVSDHAALWLEFD